MVCDVRSENNFRFGEGRSKQGRGIQESAFKETKYTVVKRASAIMSVSESGSESE